MSGAPDQRQWIPSVDRLIRRDEARPLLDLHGRERVLEALRDLLAAYRDGAGRTGQFDDEQLFVELDQRLARSARPSLRAVFNLTGTVIHTNLGRAPLAAAAAHAALGAMTGAVNLEFDLESGKRGERDAHVDALLSRLTDAQSATVVNNNAAAVFLALNTLALRREVIVSRGELVEIGGSFRIPDVMSRAGCRLREVGTTNRTHLGDYQDAIGSRTAAILKVHTSNYAIEGFHASVPGRELAALARQHGLPFLNDLGSGTLIDMRQFGLPHEPTAGKAIAEGADLVTFSGDKLLGGPQCGLIVGNKALIDKIRKNPLKRALRVDKLILAALEATLRLYENPERLKHELPALRLLVRPRDDIASLAKRLLPAMQTSLGEEAKASVVDCMSQIGSGSLPIETLPSCGIALTPRTARGGSAVEGLASRFRRLPIPVIGRVHRGSLIFDLRCLEDEVLFVAQLGQLRETDAPP